MRPDEAKSMTPTHRRALVGVALVVLAMLVLAAAAAASPRGSGSSGSGTGVAADPVATASVIGGRNTTIESYPSLAYIEGVQATAGYACTGTVVAPRVILTAGHCVEDVESGSIAEPNLIAVATGVSNLRKIAPENVSSVERVLAYPNFEPSEMHGDAGLLILNAPVAAQPIALAGPEDSALYEAADPVTVVGWGIDTLKGHVPNQLQAATLPTGSASRCATGTARFYPFYAPERQLCILDSPRFHVTICHGDSGGPAIATRPDGSMVEVGIASLSTCNPSVPAVLTRVDQISSWVQSWIDAVESGGPMPQIKIPKTHLPALTRERAEELSAFAMEEAFGNTFLHGREKTIHCARLGKARVKCGVTWFQGPNDYFGRITVFFAIRRNVVLAGVHYAIHWVDDHCYFHSGHRQTCRIRTKSR